MLPKACAKTLLQHANYDQENNNSTNALRLRRFNGVICPQILYDIVLYARYFLLVKFFLKCYFNKTCFALPQNVTCDVSSSQARINTRSATNL